MTGLYDTDYAAWADTNAELLRAGRIADADLGHIAEELEAMSKRERRALQSYLEVIVLHLLKWRYQPQLRTPSWRLSIENARQNAEKILLDSPSLQASLDDLLHKAYGYAKRSAVAETGLPGEHFPQACPFAQAQVLDPGFLPE